MEPLAQRLELRWEYHVPAHAADSGHGFVLYRGATAGPQAGCQTLDYVHLYFAWWK